MSVSILFITKEKDGLASGQEWTETYEAKEDIVVEKLFFMRKDGAPFTKSTVTLWKEETPFTESVVPANLFIPDDSASPKLDIELRDGEKLKWSLANNEGETIDVFLVIKARKVG